MRRDWPKALWRLPSLARPAPHSSFLGDSAALMVQVLR